MSEVKEAKASAKEEVVTQEQLDSVTKEAAFYKEEFAKLSKKYSKLFKLFANNLNTYLDDENQE